MKIKLSSVICILIMATLLNAGFNLFRDFKKAEAFNNEPLLIAVVEIEKVEELVPSRYGFTDEDVYLLAQVLSGSKDVSGDGEYDIDFKEEINHYEVGKVLGVIMNRVRSNEFPNTVTDVVLQKGQFSVIPRNLDREPSDITLDTVREWCAAYDNYISLVQVIPEDHLYFTGNGTINITRAK